MNTFSQKIFSPCTLSFPEKEKIFKHIQKVLGGDTQNIYLTLSGWPDSMCGVFLVFDYFFTNSLDLSRLKILHFNHKQRKESDKEAQLLQQYFSWYLFELWIYQYLWNTERDLREARWNFFVQCREKHGPGVVVTWHHLSDRVETTFLHLLRGAHIPGMMNMSFFEEKILRTKDDNIFHIPILRPLLSLSKERIQKICDRHNIPYFIDTSNQDIQVSQRNKIRKRIKQYFNWKKQRLSLDVFYQKMQYVYNFLEERQQEENLGQELSLHDIPFSQYRQCRQALWFSLPKNIQQIYKLFTYCACLAGIGTKTLEEFVWFFQKKKWWKFLQGWYFFVSHGKWYALFCPKQWWKAFWKYPQKGAMIIKEKGKISFGDFEREWTEEYIWAIVRFPQEGDTYKWKRLKKWMLNQKIPLFWRNYIPVIESKEIIPYMELLER